MKFTILVVLATSLFAAPFAAAQTCSSGTRLCCSQLTPWNQGAVYTWTQICGITPPTDPTTPTGARCEAVNGACPSGMFDLCCDRTATCQSGVDGPIGIGCVARS